MQLSVHAITKYFHHPRTRCILYKHSVTFPSGAFTVITGVSGAGKSTLLYALAGLDYVDDGHIWYGNTDIHSVSEHERAGMWQQDIGVVLQYPYLISELSVWDNIALKGHIAGADRAFLHQRVSQLLADVNLVGCAHAYPDELSGGQQQRVALARALVYVPRFVLADEPTAHLDTANTQMLLNIFTRYRDQYGCGIIVATHDQCVIHHADMVHTVQPDT